MEKNEALVLYKKGSRGEIVGIYDTVRELALKEKEFNNRFSDTTIYNCIHGRQKCYHSLAHQCKVVVKKKAFQD